MRGTSQEGKNKNIRLGGKCRCEYLPKVCWQQREFPAWNFWLASSSRKTLVVFEMVLFIPRAPFMHTVFALKCGHTNKGALPQGSEIQDIVPGQTKYLCALREIPLSVAFWGGFWASHVLQRPCFSHRNLNRIQVSVPSCGGPTKPFSCSLEVTLCIYRVIL